jgi:hypothetical protein
MKYSSDLAGGMLSTRNGMIYTPFVNGALYLAFDLGRDIRVLRKDQDHDATGFDRIDNRFAPIGPGHNITRRYPATH